MQKQFGYDNMMRVPRLQKVVINMGVGDARDDAKLVDAAAADLKRPSPDRKPRRSAAPRKSPFANFKISAKACRSAAWSALRGDRMWGSSSAYAWFTPRCRRIRDFQGVSDKSFDGRGNYSLGVREQLIFPEINVDNVVKTRGMDITFVTTALTDDEARALLRELGTLPMRKSGRASCQIEDLAEEPMAKKSQVVKVGEAPASEVKSLFKARV